MLISVYTNLKKEPQIQQQHVSPKVQGDRKALVAARRPRNLPVDIQHTTLILLSSKSCKSSNSMYPKVQGDRKALVAARRPRNLPVDIQHTTLRSVSEYEAFFREA